MTGTKQQYDRFSLPNMKKKKKRLNRKCKCEISPKQGYTKEDQQSIG